MLPAFFMSTSQPLLYEPMILLNSIAFLRGHPPEVFGAHRAAFSHPFRFFLSNSLTKSLSFSGFSLRLTPSSTISGCS